MKKALSIAFILHSFELLILQFLFLDLSLKTYLLKDKSYDDERICSFLNLPIVNLQTQKSFIKKWIKNVHLTMTLKVSKGQSKILKWMIVCRLQDKHQYLIFKNVVLEMSAETFFFCNLYCQQSIADLQIYHSTNSLKTQDMQGCCLMRVVDVQKRIQELFQRRGLDLDLITACLLFVPYFPTHQ